MDAKQFLTHKGISNNDFMDSGVADLIETLLTEYHTLQLQQTDVSGSVADTVGRNCPFCGDPCVECSHKANNR